MMLPDETKVFPAHGAGSACGKNLSTETVSTIGEQRRTNYALAPMVVEDFVDVVTQGQTPAPLYFLYAANRDREAHALLPDDVRVNLLTIDQALKHQNGGAVVIDSRDDTMFASGHLRGSVNVGLSGRFAEYVGEVMEPGTPIIIVAEPGSESEARTRLARIGFDNVVGALDNPYGAFIENPGLVERLSRLSVETLAERMGSVKSLVVIDVRNHGEFALGHLPGARHIPLPELLHAIDDLDPASPIVVNCAGGYRSAIASSLLRSKGFSDVSDLIGGYTAWANSNIPVSLPTIDVRAAFDDTTSVRLDCREIDEWDSGHDPRAMHIPMAELPARIGEFDKSRRIIVICRSGNRSGKVTAWLTGLGYDAVNMVGGMQAWSAAGLTLIDRVGSAGSVI